MLLLILKLPMLLNHTIVVLLFSVVLYSAVPELLLLSGKYGVYRVALALVSMQLPLVAVGVRDAREDPYLQSEPVWQAFPLQCPA